MPLTKTQKQKTVADLKDKLTRQKSLVFVDVKGVKVKEITDLKKKLKEVDAELRVAKKTLFSLACKEAGVNVGVDQLSGQPAFVFGFEDEVMPAKEVYQFAERAKVSQVLGGYMEGRMLSAQEVVEIAKLPGRQELLVRAVGSIASPLSGLANVLQGNIKGLLYALRAYNAKLTQN